jgi:hypothetical protein
MDLSLEENRQTQIIEKDDKEPFSIAFKSKTFLSLCVMAFSYSCKLFKLYFSLPFYVFECGQTLRKSIIRSLIHEIPDDLHSGCQWPKSNFLGVHDGLLPVQDTLHYSYYPGSKKFI